MTSRTPRPLLPRPQLPRRRILLTALAASPALLAVGCGPSPVATSSQVPRDPLAELDPQVWNARTAEELRALPIQGAAVGLEGWQELGEDDSTLDDLRDEITTFVDTAYLSPARQQDLDPAEREALMLETVPQTLAEKVTSTWAERRGHFLSFALAPNFRTVGAPAIAAGWHRASDDGTPALVLAATIAHTVIDTTTRRVGVMAIQVGLVAAMETDGSPAPGRLHVLLHGLDDCATDAANALLTPALEEAENHEAAQRATMAEVIEHPVIAPEDVLEDSGTFTADHRTYVEC